MASRLLTDMTRQERRRGMCMWSLPTCTCEPSQVQSLKWGKSPRSPNTTDKADNDNTLFS